MGFSQPLRAGRLQLSRPISLSSCGKRNGSCTPPCRKCHSRACFTTARQWRGCGNCVPPVSATGSGGPQFQRERTLSQSGQHMVSLRVAAVRKLACLVRPGVRCRYVVQSEHAGKHETAALQFSTRGAARAKRSHSANGEAQKARRPWERSFLSSTGRGTFFLFSRRKERMGGAIRRQWLLSS